MPIIQANFTILDKVDNKSNCYFYKCNHCAEDGAGACIEGQDNKHIKHLTDPKKCLNAPPDVCKEAHIFLTGKGLNDTIHITAAMTTTSSIKSDISPSVLKVQKKQKGTTLDGFIDYPLTLAHQK